MARRIINVPRSLEALRGLRAALWVRESTVGQWENLGPDSQRHEYARALERYGLVDSGIAWSVAASGWKTVWLTPAWAEMMAAAAERRFDVLVIGYSSRLARNLRQMLEAIERLHAMGVVVLLVDERILSSDPADWEQFAREALEAESYSRRLARRVGQGYAAKRRLGIPGGRRPPYGTRREGRPSVLRVDEPELAVVREAYDLSAGGLTDREVAERVGLRLSHVHEILTNPFYFGRLSDGAPSALGALVDPATWEQVQVNRARYSRRHRGTAKRRQYALSGLLACGACGRRLTGHVERFRHVDACATFKAAAPLRRRTAGRGIDHRARGESYPAATYDGLIEATLAHVAANARLVADVIAHLPAERPVRADRLLAARIAKERDHATKRFLADRDVGALQVAMARLDAQEQEAATERPLPAPTAAQARRYLGDLPRLWRTTGPEGRRAIAAAAFERIDAIGLDLVLHLTPEADAYGWAEAFAGKRLVVKIDRGPGPAIEGTVRVAVRERGAMAAVA